MGGNSAGRIRQRRTNTAIARIQPTAPPQQVLPETMAPLAAGMSVARFTADERQRLMAPYEDDQVDIKPTGEVYVSHIFIRNRLNEIFGPGDWGLMDEPPQQKGKSIIQRYVLLIRGTPVASAYGESTYIESNKRHSWGKALESAKSNSLTRCAKDLGMAAVCWSRRWQFAYRMRHGVLVNVRNREGRIESQWRHVSSPPLPSETGVADASPNKDRYIAPTEARRTAAEAVWSPEPEVLQAEPVEHTASLVPLGDAPIGAGPGQRQIRAAMRTHGISEEAVKAFIRKEWGLDSTKDIRQSQLPTMLSWIRAPWDA